MTLDQWLQEATGTFPPGIRERLAQEYTAHLEDSVAAGGSGNALELFGEPLQVKQRLKKLYITQERLEQVKKSLKVERLFWCMSVFLILFNLKFVIDFFGTRFFTRFLLEFILIALPFLLVWVCSCRWEKTRRASFQSSTFAIALSVNTIYSLVFDSPDQSYVTTGLVVAPIMIVGFIYILIEDKRIERTLKFQGRTRVESQSKG